MKRDDVSVPTIRLRLEGERTLSDMVVFELLDAGMRREARVPAYVFGMKGLPFTVDQYRGFLPREVMQRARHLWECEGLAEMLWYWGGRNIWLSIDKRHPHLAAFPWEILLEDLADCRVFRPSRRSLPIMPPDEAPVVICVSAPDAKRPFSIVDACDRLIRYLRSFSGWQPITIFADRRAWDDLDVMARRVWRYPVRVERVWDEDRLALGDVNRRLAERGDRIDSPWLSWMLSALKGQQVHSVHFLGHGYFAGATGALALARSPAQNLDPYWSHFVEANELALFLDLVGVPSVHVHPAADDVWSMGLRLLARDLARLRPGRVHIGLSLDEGAAWRRWSRRYGSPLGEAMYCDPADVGPAEFAPTRDGEPSFVEELGRIVEEHQYRDGRRSGESWQPWQIKSLVQLARAAAELEELPASDEEEYERLEGRWRALKRVAEVTLRAAE